MIIFSDVHLREETADVVLGQVLPGIVKAASELKCSDVACLGDFYHFRYRLDVGIQNAVLDFLRLASFIKWRFLPGNHDQINPAGRNALEVFGDMPNVRVYTEPTVDKDGLWIPYRHDSADVIKALEAHPKPVVFMHVGFVGAYMNNAIQNTDGIAPEQVADRKIVLTGHYHRRQKLGDNIHYIGSPYETKADEIGQPKGYAFWDGKTLKFFDTQWGPKHHRVWIDKASQLTPDAYAPGDKVWAYVSRDEGPLVAKKFQEAGVDVVLQYQAEDKPRERLKVDPNNQSLWEYARAYVEQAETTLDKEKLMAVLRDATGGTP